MLYSPPMVFQNVWHKPNRKQSFYEDDSSSLVVAAMKKSLMFSRVVEGKFLTIGVMEGPFSQHPFLSPTKVVFNFMLLIYTHASSFSSHSSRTTKAINPPSLFSTPPLEKCPQFVKKNEKKNEKSKEGKKEEEKGKNIKRKKTKNERLWKWRRKWENEWR